MIRMRLYNIVLALLFCAAVSGCDFLRTVAGRPTSTDLAVMKEAIENERLAKEAAIRDSIAAVLRMEAEAKAAKRDSVLLDSLGKARILFRPSRFGGIREADTDARYMVAVGSFQTRSFAERKVLSSREAGFEGAIVTFRSGLNIVGLCPSERLSEVYSTLLENRGKGVFPKASWILVNE